MRGTLFPRERYQMSYEGIFIPYVKSCHKTT